MEKRYLICHNEGCKRPTREPKISNRGHQIHYKDCHVCANLKSNYRITGPERDKLCEKQNWKCAICKDTVSLPPANDVTARSPKDAVVDHNHKKPKVAPKIKAEILLAGNEINKIIETPLRR